MQDLGAAGPDQLARRVRARGGVGAEIDVDASRAASRGHDAYEVMLSETQERMLLVVRPDAVDEVKASLRAGSSTQRHGEITDEPS